MVFAVDRNLPLPELRATIAQIKITLFLFVFPPACDVPIPASATASKIIPLPPAQLNPSSTLYVVKDF